MEPLITQLENHILEIQQSEEIKYPELAEMTGLPKSTLFSVFGESQNPTLNVYEKLLKFTGCYIECDEAAKRKSVLRYKKFVKKREKKRLGKLLGRPKGNRKSRLDQYKSEIEALLNNGRSKTFIANKYKTSLANFCKWMKKYGLHTVKKSK